MFTSKKHVLFTFAIAMCSLGLTASYREQETKSAVARQGYFDWIKQAWSTKFAKPDKKTARFGERISNAPREIQNLIAEFAEDNEYKPVTTLNAPGNLLAFNDKGTTLTSAGPVDDFNRAIKVVTRTTDRGRLVKEFTIEPRHRDMDDLLLSGDGTTLVVNGQIIDTGTGNIKESVPFHALSINHNGTMLAGTLEGALEQEQFNDQAIEPSGVIRLYNRTTKERIELATDSDAHSNGLFSHDSTTFALISGSNILLFDTKTGHIKNTIDGTENLVGNRQGGFIRSFALNKNKSLLAYSTTYPNKRHIVLVDLTNEERPRKETHFRSCLSDPSCQIQRIGFGSNILYFITNKDSLLTLQFLDITKNTIVQKIELPSASVLRSVLLSPDEKILAIGTTANIHIWKKAMPVQDMIRQEEQILEFRARKNKENQEKDKRAQQAKREMIEGRLSTMPIWYGRPKPSTASSNSQIPATTKQSSNVFYRAAMQQARQKKPIPLSTDNSRHDLTPAVEPLDIDMPKAKPIIRPTKPTTIMDDTD